jgi:hypothetical protein
MATIEVLATAQINNPCLVPGLLLWIKAFFEIFNVPFSRISESL